MPSPTSRHGECSAKKAVVTELRWTSTPACSKRSSGYSSLRPMNKPPRSDERADLAKQLDFTDFETTSGGTWRSAGCRDYWSKYELGWHVSPTANQHDAIAAVELALT